MAIYSIKIFSIFLLFSLLGLIWVVIFLKKRKQLDYLRFQRASTNENVMYELITGMQEIKLNNCETTKRWGWERVQAQLFKLSVKSLALGQLQGIGSSFFNQLKNIIISYISAREVISGNITLGMMMSISYIVGQLNSPMQQLLGFIQSAQDAKISLDRLSEIHLKDNEETADLVQNIQSNVHSNEDKQSNLTIPSDQSGIRIQNLSFQYEGTSSQFVLKDINLFIPKGRVSAIVGMSGSGKTTLLKLLLKYYKPTSGSIYIDGYDLQTISPKWWRSQCGTVMQDGYIFNDTIAGNISLTESANIDQEKLRKAVNIASISDFITRLPLGYNTQIGFNGLGISAGQKQRLLIARAVYKTPSFLLLDEATNTLDANNEKAIMNSLDEFFVGKTVVVIAHRLSTVKNADQIIVLDNGFIAETGNHQLLIEKKGKYYELVKNQLELGM
jgi:ATP-binding cassette subfamily B protein